jgi:ketosteroid isomerase-like protein
MTPDQIDSYVKSWIDAWNRRDAEAVLAHFSNDVRFTSPTAERVVGVPTVIGKAALRSYWLAALERSGELRFTLDRALWDGERNELAIVYYRDVNGQLDKACELLAFDGSGQVARGEAMYGVAEWRSRLLAGLTVTQ